MSLECHPDEPNAIETNLCAIFVSWNFVVPLRRSHRCRLAAERRCRNARCVAAMSPGSWGACETSGQSTDEDREVFPFIVVQEAGLHGFWIHRVLFR
jgi:hypothetical protein